jgi:cupin fold WbuC family metalloprotein
MRLFSQSLFDELASKASSSPRRRSHHNVHSSPADLVQRFFVSLEGDSYFRPHRHLSKSELALVLRGQIDIITFDDAGAITGRYTIGEGTPHIGYETPHAVWHTLVSQGGRAIFFEVNEGPYDPATALEFAPWAPPEGHVSVPQFMQWVRTAPAGALPPVF